VPRPHRSGWLLLALSVCSLAAVAGDARDWLARMAAAGDSLDYEGTFVYTQGGRMETLRVVHKAGDDGPRERLISLNGTPREVLRGPTGVVCIMPDKREVLEGRADADKPFAFRLPDNLAALEESYHIQHAGEDRVASLPARIVAIQPRDALRYGYRLWLHADHGMLLRSDLLDETGEIVEQMMFTQLRIGESVDPAELQPTLNADGYRRRQAEEHGDTPAAEVPWRVTQLPSGFVQTGSGRVALGEGGAQQLVFSDGLASVSVFIEQGDEAEHGLTGASRIGAVTAYGVRLAQHRITAVGEVPVAAVELIANSTEPSP